MSRMSGECSSTYSQPNHIVPYTTFRRHSKCRNNDLPICPSRIVNSGVGAADLHHNNITPLHQFPGIPWAKLDLCRVSVFPRLAHTWSFLFQLPSSPLTQVLAIPHFPQHASRVLCSRRDALSPGVLFSVPLAGPGPHVAVQRVRLWRRLPLTDGRRKTWGAHPQAGFDPTLWSTLRYVVFHVRQSLRSPSASAVIPRQLYICMCYRTDPCRRLVTYRPACNPRF